VAQPGWPREKEKEDMNGWITSLACVGVLLFLVVGGFILVRDQIRGARQLGQLGRYLFGTFKADKEEWEKNKASQQGADPVGAGETDPSGRVD